MLRAQHYLLNSSVARSEDNSFTLYVRKTPTEVSLKKLSSTPPNRMFCLSRDEVYETATYRAQYLAIDTIVKTNASSETLL